MNIPRTLTAPHLGVSPEVNQGVSTLVSTIEEVRRSLAGCPTEAMQERARVRLGDAIAAAEALRRRLPDPHGLRTGNGAQRVARALGLFQRTHEGFASVAAIAALVECGHAETLGLLRRADLKGWAQVQQGWSAAPETTRWSLTDEGWAFVEAAEAVAEPSARP